MRLIFISDTHGFHNNIKIPEGDILIHCGDSTIYGELWEFKNFLEWFGNQKPKHKAFICGNHEVVVGKKEGQAKDLVKAHNKYHFTNINYLEESGVEIEGLKIWGSPYTPEFFDWQFMYDREDAEKRWMGIPEDVDILITHGPPYGILDEVKPFDKYQYNNAGCKVLARKVQEIRPLIHAFGHIHKHPGYRMFGDTLCINATNCNENYIPKHKPIIVDVIDGKVEVVNDI